MTTAADAGRGGGRRLPRLVHRRWGAMADVAIPAVAFAAVFAVHDTGYALRAPYWIDEAWVAVSLKVPVSRITDVASSTPLGWIALLRLTSGQQGARLVPLVFAGLAAAAAYWFGRELQLGRLASAGLPVVTLFVPAILARDDLKQYTAEAFVSVALAALLTRAHRLGTRRSLAVLTAAVVISLPFANATLFVGSAALIALALTALVSRQWRRLVDVVVAGVVTGIVWLGWLVPFVLPARSTALTQYWLAYYPPRSLHGLRSYLDLRIHQLGASAVGLHSGTVVVVGLLAASALLALQGEAPLALLPLIAFAELVVAGLAHSFPVLDERTSTWLITLVVVVVFGAVGRTLAGPWVVRWIPAGRWVAVVGAAGVLALAGSYAYSARAGVRSHPIPVEDVRDQAIAVASAREPGDVVVVDLGANWGYAYYGGSPTPILSQSSSTVANGYVVRYADPNTIAFTARTPAAVEAAYASAVARIALTHGSHIWLVRSHMRAAEQAGWNIALAHADVVRSDPDGLVEVAVG